MKEIVGADIMDDLCGALSPINDSGLCRRWRECKMNSVPTHPDEIFGVPIPVDIVYMQPPGVALDNTWLARINAHQRDLPAGEDPAAVGPELFDRAVKLATAHTEAWLKQLGGIMRDLGDAEEAFWTDVRTVARTGDLDSSFLTDSLASTDDDIEQFEKADKLPSTFLSAGNYPPDPGGADEGWFVRLQLRTDDDDFDAGTNADIDVRFTDDQTFRLDHGQKDNRLLEHDDFQRGDDTWYVVGPFAQPPGGMTLINHGAGIGDIVEAAWEDLKSILSDVIERIEEFLLSLIGGNADFVGTDKLTRSWAELLDIEARGGQDYELRCVGDGDYKIHGRITATFQPDGSLQVGVLPQILECVKETSGAGSDEPFLLHIVNSPAANKIVKGRSKVFEDEDVDTGDSVALGMPETRIEVPRHGGLIIANAVWESDSEGSDKRDELLNEFALKFDEGTESFRSQFLDAIGEAILPDWRLAAVDAYAFRRGYLTRTTPLAVDRQVNQWVEAGGELHVPFDQPGPTRTVVVPALRPAIESHTLLPGGNVAALAVGDGTVYASVGPQVVQGTPPRPSTLHRLGQHLEPGATTSVSPGARNLALDTKNQRLYAVTMNDSVRRYDPATLQQQASAPIGFGAWDVAVADGGTLVFVSRWRVDGGAVFVLRADDLGQVALLTASPTTPGFHGTLGLAADPDGKRAFVARSFRSGGEAGPVVAGLSRIVPRPAGGFVVADSTLSEQLIQPVDVAVDDPAGLVFVAGLGGGGVHPRLLVYNQDGPLSLQRTVLLPGSARAVAALPGTGIAYVASDAGLCLVDGVAGTLLLTVPLGPGSNVIAVDPDTGATFIGSRTDGTVRRVDTAAILG